MMISEPFEIPTFECTGIKRDQNSPDEFVMNVIFNNYHSSWKRNIDDLSNKYPNVIFYPLNKDAPQVPFTQIRLIAKDLNKSLIVDFIGDEISWDILENTNFKTIKALVAAKEVHNYEGKKYFQLILISTMVCHVNFQDNDFEKDLFKQLTCFENDLFKQLTCFVMCKGPCKQKVIVSSLKSEIKDHCLNCSNNEVQRRLNQIVRAVCERQMIMKNSTNLFGVTM